MATPVLRTLPATPTRRRERYAQQAVRSVVRVPGARRLLLSPVVARPGFWLATGCGLVWGAICGPATFHRSRRLIVASGMPRRAFGRGGTTIGAVYLTHDNHADTVLEHEDVHREQWRRYGLAFIALYLAAGANPLSNRYELEAGLTKGGYR